MKTALSAASLLSLLSSVSSGRADDSVKFAVEPILIQVGTANSKVKAAATIDTDGDLYSGQILALTFKAPTTDVVDTTQARLDDLGTGWRMGASFTQQFSWPSPQPPAGCDVEPAKSNDPKCKPPVKPWKAAATIDGEYGPREFSYFPEGGSDKASTLTHSFGVGLSGFVSESPREAPVWALQLLSSFSRDWKEATRLGSWRTATRRW